MIIKISDSTLCKAIRRTSEVSTESGGILVGKMKDEELLINGLETGQQSATHVHVTLHDEFLVETATKYAERDEKIVGWYHSHPKMGCFMSSTDIDTQRRYQALFPNAVALVIDPQRPIFRFYQVEDSSYTSVEYDVLENI
ncbi:Mov34/MPN/PAD-1 family protein [Candidatus Borrarchaeum sp.]|uniref:Mov34/MPN/PAD-1 family protein n=1 Tax=Candidatus Borrarchaeum sp. TaxID=2846742 RepID=UPI00257D3919|nr:Mov34/MPN/PAD-1 family protein [Candidatus Borrarchaeum sp.]